MPTSHVKFGEDMAILGGDALLSKSFEICAKVRAPAGSAPRAPEMPRCRDAVMPRGAEA